MEYSSNNGTYITYDVYDAFSEDEPAFTPGIQPLTSVIVGIIITICIVSTNAFLQVAILCSRRLRRRPSSWLLLNICVADLLVGLVITPLVTYYEIRNAWDLGRPACLSWLIMDILLSCVSFLGLLMVNIDCLARLHRPARYLQRIKPGVALAMVCLTWTVSLIIVLPLFFEAQSKDLEMGVTGICFVELSPSYAVGSSISTYAIPGLVVMCLNAALVGVYCQRKRKIYAGQNEASRQDVPRGHAREPPQQYSVVPHRNGSPHVNTYSGERPHHRQATNGKTHHMHRMDKHPRKHHRVETHEGTSTQQGQSLLSKSRKGNTITHQRRSFEKMRTLVITMCVVNIVYILMKLPFYGFNLLLGAGYYDLVSTQAMYVVIWMAYANSSVAPLLWFIFADTRKAMLNLLCCVWCRGKKGPTRNEDDTSLELTQYMITTA